MHDLRSLASALWKGSTDGKHIEQRVAESQGVCGERKDTAYSRGEARSTPEETWPWIAQRFRCSQRTTSVGNEND
jgi:hypothetical protein